jgi:predicted AlkP superfamily phosphohydrolase/phosphomutase
MLRRSIPWLLLLLLPLLAGTGPHGCAPRPRVLLVGIDGGDWDVMDPLMEAGYLPSFRQLLSGAARAGLDCYPSAPSVACFCPPVWNSIATGRSRAEHGIPNFYDLSTTRMVKAIWDVLDDYGRTSTVLAMRNTWPTEPGIDFNFTEEGLDFASTRIYDRWGGDPAPRAADESLHTQPPYLFNALGMLPHVGARPPLWSMFARDRVAMDALRRLTRIRRTDFTFIVLHGPDKAEHLHWAGIQPEQNGPFDLGVLLSEASRYSGPVTGPGPWSFGTVSSQYQEADAWLGRYLRSLHYDYVMLVSDHGMGRNPVPGLPGQHGTLNPEAHIGIFALTGPGVRAGNLGVVSVFDVAPTLAYLLGLPVGEDLPGRMLEEAFSESWLDAHPLVYVESWEPPPAAG